MFFVNVIIQDLTVILSPNLPLFRLNKSAPFSACGIDYAGPLYTKNVYNDQQENISYLNVTLFYIHVLQTVELC